MNDEPAVPALTGVAVESDGALSRGDLLLKAVLATGAVYGLGAVGPFVQRVFAAEEEPSDVDILNFLLIFEHLQASLYNRGNSEENDKGEEMKLKAKEKELMELLLRQEGEHVAAVKQQIEKLGGKADEKGEFAFAFREYSTLLELAATIEKAAIGAYNGAIPSLRSREARELAFSIVQVEGRHAAAVLIPNKEEPAPEAFDIGLSEISAMNYVIQFTGVFPE